MESGEATASQASRRRVETQRADAEAGVRQARWRRVQPRDDTVRGWSNDDSNGMTCLVAMGFAIHESGKAGEWWQARSHGSV
jgi:hypothetical protein